MISPWFAQIIQLPPGPMPSEAPCPGPSFTPGWPPRACLPEAPGRRLTQTARAALSLHQRGLNVQGWQTARVMTKTHSLPQEPDHSSPPFMLWFGVFREKQRPSPCHSYVTTCIPVHLPPTPSTSFDKCSWITWDGPKGQGPETLPAWLSKATGKHSMCFREQVGFPPHKSSFVSV